MSSIDEKRVYDARAGKTEAFVAAEMGVAAVEIAGDRVGRFRLARRCRARDVAASAGRLLVATDEDVLVGTGDGFETASFGPAVAVGVGYDGGLLAARPDGEVARRDGGGWEPLGNAGAVRAVGGDLVATAGGVCRIVDGGLAPAGLSDVRDVSATGVPLAATASGLYWLGNGWMDAHDGAFRIVAADGGGRAHAATADALYAGGGSPDDWEPRELPTDDPVAGVAYGEGVVAVMETGTVLVDAGDGWRSRSIGLDEVAGVAVPGEP
ncbi:hypothetical protein BRC83_06720 [Halobacteriales archaeon QS_1_68_17]|nr:MAG: hypothetical protein BRC83_06720 [Halobacteriales archaeon QS_1_68_17]